MMKGTFIVTLALLALCSPVSLLRGATWPGSGPLDLQGEIAGGPYKIRILANWNGTLVVYTHGYKAKANRPGETEDRNPYQLEGKFDFPPTQSLDHTYTLTKEEKNYLASLGVDAESLLLHMDRHHIYRANSRSRAAMAAYGSYTGKLKRPMIDIQGRDPLATPENEHVYRQISNLAGKGHLLLQVFTTTRKNCNFTQQQLLTALQQMESWIDTGKKPELSSFPESQGFDHAFRPDPWPWPTGQPAHQWNKRRCHLRFRCINVTGFLLSRRT